MQQLSFRIDCTPSKQEEVRQILDSLLKLGTINGYSKSINWIDPEGTATDEELLVMVNESKHHAETNKTYTTEEAKALVKKWQQEKR